MKTTKLRIEDEGNRISLYQGASLLCWFPAPPRPERTEAEFILDLIVEAEQWISR